MIRAGKIGMGGIFGRIDAWITTLILAVVMIAAWAIGFRLGHLRRSAGEEAGSGNFRDAAIALLGLLLAFTFSMSLGKYDYRRLMLVSDANSMGDFYTCATLLDEPVRTDLRRLVRDYAVLRLEADRLPESPPAPFEQAIGKIEAMQSQMTDLVHRAIRDGTPIAIPLTDTLNAVASNETAHLAAVRDRLPTSIVLLLYLSAAMATALVGVRQGGAGRRPRLPEFVGFVLLVCLVVYVILDLNQPSRGLITISHEPLERLIATMEK
jgi:hypothetical protein